MPVTPILWSKAVTHFKMYCPHDLGFQWFYNRAAKTEEEEQGWSCKAGCGYKLPFNPDKFLEGPDVKVLKTEGTHREWKDPIPLSKGGKF